MLKLIKSKLKLRKVLSNKNNSNNHSTTNCIDDEKMIDAITKYTPQSDFIYNGVNSFILGDLHKMNSEQKDNIIKELVDANYNLRKENEQFRTKNFKYYLMLRKMGVNVSVDKN